MIKVFVLMPFVEKFFSVYNMLKEKFRDSYIFSNAGDEGNSQNILKDIIQPIYESDIILADVTGLNSNVLYELGIAHSFNKKTIIITQDELSALPFDLKQYRVKYYTSDFIMFDELLEFLKKNLAGAVDGSIKFSNPVSDFLAENHINNKWLDDSIVIDTGESKEKGFLDFLAEIETDAISMTNEITAMSEEINLMSEKTKSSLFEINRVSSNGGSGTTIFRRNESRKIAGYINEFRTQLTNHNKSYNTYWDKIEANTLGLLENTFAVSNNKQILIGYLKSLIQMKITTSNSKNIIQNLIETMNNIYGIEASMNQAIKLVISELSNYSNFTIRVCDSIDKIINKSRYVVGDIL
jgi:hypothetical protein